MCIRDRLNEQFPRIFGDGGVEVDDEKLIDDINSVLGRYGWFHFLEEIAERDPIKIEQILQNDLLFIFTHYNYLLDYRYVERNHIQPNN